MRELLRIHFGDRYQELTFKEAWKLLLSTPRYYRDATTLVNWDGSQSVPVPLLTAPPGCGSG